MGVSAPRVVVYHNIVAPYRHALFAALASRLELGVWYALEGAPDRDWDTVRPPTYCSELLGARSIHAFGRPLVWSPGLARRLRDRRPQAVIATLAAGNVLDLLRLARICNAGRIPFVPWVGEVPRAKDSGDPVPSVIRQLFDRAAAAVLGQADGVLCYSERSREWASRRGARGPFAVGTQGFAPPLTSPRFLTEDQNARWRVLFVGKLERRKGVDLLVEAVLGLPEVTRSRLEVEIIGHGPLEAVLERLRAAGVPTRHSAALFGVALEERMRSADLLVLPSRHDPWGNVINEAMALGTPVLASTAAGGADLARVAGWTVAAGDAAALSNALAGALLESREPQRRRRAVAAVSQYTPEAVADRVVELIARVRPGAA